MSGRKTFLPSYKLVSAGSLASTLTSPASNAATWDTISYQVNITSGTPTGTFQVQTSDDYNQDFMGNVLNAGNWVNVSEASLAVSAGTPANLSIKLQELPDSWVRIVYTPTGGSGTADIFVAAKML